MMEVFVIPVQDKYLIYRPLRRLAFIGNRAMADLALRFTSSSPDIPPDGPIETFLFLKKIGFTQPDPPAPVAVDLNSAFQPTSAALLMTGRCNLRCIYCYASGGEKENQDLPLESATAVIDQVCHHAIELGKPFFEVTFHGGGEPSLAWETLKTAATYARTRDLPARLHMVSNGVWNRAHREWVIANLDGLTISMDGRQITQDAQRPFPNGRGSYKAVMQTIHFLDKANFSYNIRITATPERFDRLPEDVEFFCKETKCQNIQVEPSFLSSRGAHHIPTPNQAMTFSEAFLSAYDKANATGRFIYYSGARPWLLTSTFCTAPVGSALTINPRGEIVACYEITNPDHPFAMRSTFGQIENLSGKIQIDKDRRYAFLDYLENRRTYCRDCFCYWHCAGDCYTRSLENSNHNNEFPFARCMVNRNITTGLLMRYIANTKDGVYRGNLLGHHTT